MPDDAIKAFRARGQAKAAEKKRKATPAPKRGVKAMPKFPKEAYWTAKGWRDQSKAGGAFGVPRGSGSLASSFMGRKAKRGAKRDRTQEPRKGKSSRQSGRR